MGHILIGLFPWLYTYRKHFVLGTSPIKWRHSPDMTIAHDWDIKKVQLGNDQEMVLSERNSQSTNRGWGWGKSNMTLRYLYQENIS